MSSPREPTHARGTRLAHAAGAVAIGTAISKVIGLIREIVVAHAYGTGIIADAYYYVYLLTGNFFVLLGGFNGPIDSCLVSIAGNESAEQQSAFVRRTALLISLYLGGLTLLLALLAPLVVPTIANFYAPGTSVHGSRQLFSQELLLQLFITLPMVVLGGLLGVLYAIARLEHKIFVPAIAPAIGSAVIIGTIWTGDHFHMATGWLLASATTASAFAQLLVQMPGWRRFVTPAIQPNDVDVQPLLASFWKMLGPALLTTSVGQLTVYVDAAFTWGLGTGAWTAIAYSNRLIQLPLGIINTAILIPIFPRFVEAVGNSDLNRLVTDLNRCMRFLWFLTLPMVAIFSALGKQIIELILEGGHFTGDSVDLVAMALAFLVPQMFFYLGRELIARVFWAFRDTTTPFRIAVAVLFIKAALDAILVGFFHMGVAGISLATTLMSALSFGLSLWLLRQHTPVTFRTLLAPLSIMLASSLLCFLAIAQTHQLIVGHLPSSKIGLLIDIGVSASVGTFGYLLCGYAARLEEVKLLSELLRQSLQKVRRQ